MAIRSGGCRAGVNRGFLALQSAGPMNRFTIAKRSMWHRVAGGSKRGRLAGRPRRYAVIVVDSRMSMIYDYCSQIVVHCVFARSNQITWRSIIAMMSGQWSERGGNKKFPLFSLLTPFPSPNSLPFAWNSLPTAIPNIDRYPAFRRALMSRLFSCYPTDIVKCTVGHVIVDWALEHLLYCIVLYWISAKGYGSR